MAPLGAAIFLVTYVLISARRLEWLGFDRPAAALLGAVSCVVLGVLSPEEALAAVDGATLLLLFGVMGMGAFLAVDGAFEAAEGWLLSAAGSPARLLGFVVWGAGIGGALITNDAVCLLAAPLVVRLVVAHNLPSLPFLLALATAANTGSVATLVGNPQNMLCGLLGDLSFRNHLALMGPLAIVGLALNHGVLWLAFRRELARATLTRGHARPPLSPRALFTIVVILATAIAYSLGTDLAWTAAAGFVLLLLGHRRDARELWPRIDFSLLLFFGGLFVAVEGFAKSGAPGALFAAFPLDVGEGFSKWLRLSGIFMVGSNVVSNVPFILIVQEQMHAFDHPKLAWELLAMASTFAGNLTLLGSVANIIVAEAGREVGGVGFWQYLRVGLPVALLTTLLGVLWLSFAAGVFPALLR
ncbi:MAG TPA: SLC13 family permease [Polyangiaceae bacterium]|nr:SLC13 family permease [Polyangiaceae bacterium]